MYFYKARLRGHPIIYCKEYDFRNIIFASYINSHTDAGDERDFIVKTYDVMTSMLPKMYFLQGPRDSVSLLAE